MRPFLKTLGAAALLTLSAVDASAADSALDPDGFGLLVMAHGGSPDWNEGVLAAVEPLKERHPVEVAFGMADACSIQESVRALEARGVRKIGVVRLFISGESWFERTEQILGLKEGAPAAKAADCSGGDGGHAHHSMALFRIDTRASFTLSTEGLAQAPEMGQILAERAADLSREPANEDVVVLAHGPADDAENERWLATIDARASEIRRSRPFHSVQVFTLREDWPEKRKEAEQRIRDFVAQSAKEGRRTLVIPFRLFGFGPYAQVLEGQPYSADKRGLLPHANVTRWIARQVEELRSKD